MYTITNLRITDNTVAEPVALADIKAWLQIDFADYDTMLTNMGKGARISLERWMGRAITPKSVVFDVEVSKTLGDVPLPYGVAQAVTIDTSDGTPLTEDTDYTFRGFIRFNATGRYMVSYDAETLQGEDVKEAIKMEVAERFANRGENSKDISSGAKERLMTYKMLWV